ncbi:MAG: hypothetical protein PVI57_11695 [Gemmatimonadota bacterium]|jgi:hypothetical protein
MSEARVTVLRVGLCLSSFLSPGPLAGQYYRLIPTHHPSVALELAKPFMGGNYGTLTSVLEARVSLPLAERAALTGQVAVAHATAGRRSSSTTIARPALGVTVEGPSLLEAELVVGLPLRWEKGDDDYATDVAILSDRDRRERFTRPRWTAAVTGVARRPLGTQGVIGLRVGGLVLFPRAGSTTDLDVRYGLFVRLRPAASFDVGTEFHGTARATGPAASFEQRSSHTITFLLSPTRLPGAPELLLHLPIDAGVEEYVQGMIGLRLSF